MEIQLVLEENAIRRIVLSIDRDGAFLIVEKKEGDHWTRRLRDIFALSRPVAEKLRAVLSAWLREGNPACVVVNTLEAAEANADGEACNKPHALNQVGSFSNVPGPVTQGDIFEAFEQAKRSLKETP